MKFPALLLLVLFLAAYPLASAQRRDNWPSPPEAADKSVTTPGAAASTVKMSLDLTQIQHEAKELLELSQSLQTDIQYVNRGMLPKDTVAKLKRIEKISKHLRGELGN